MIDSWQLRREKSVKGDHQSGDFCRSPIVQTLFRAANCILNLRKTKPISQCLLICFGHLARLKIGASAEADSSQLQACLALVSSSLFRFRSADVRTLCTSCAYHNFPPWGDTIKDERECVVFGYGCRAASLFLPILFTKEILLKRHFPSFVLARFFWGRFSKLKSP